MTDLHFKIASCNLQNLNEHSATHKLENFILALKNELEMPDIIALQEIGSEAINQDSLAIANVGFVLSEMIYLATHIQYHYIDIPPIQNSTGGAQDFNIRPAFLIKSDIAIIEKHQIGMNEPAFIGDESLIFKASRYPLVLIIEKEQRQLKLINCHLKSQNSRTNQEKKLAKKQRNHQAEIIRKYCENSAQNLPIILLGDFNDTPNSDTLRILSTETFISAWTQHQGRLYTTKHRNCPVVIDYILISKNITFQNPQVHHINTNLKHPHRFSDHDPISVDVYL